MILHEAEQPTLLAPADWEGLEQPIQRKVCRLPSFEDGPLNIRPQEGQPAELPIIGVLRGLDFQRGQGSVGGLPSHGGCDPMRLAQRPDQHRITTTPRPSPCGSSFSLAARGRPSKLTSVVSSSAASVTRRTGSNS